MTRQSNIRRRTPDTEHSEPITLKASDGPATRRIRNANIYTAGQNINLRCEVLTGIPATLVCTVTPTETGEPTTVDVDQQTRLAEHTPTRAGQHRYTFTAKDNDGNVRATASGIYVTIDA